MWATYGGVWQNRLSAGVARLHHYHRSLSEDDAGKKMNWEQHGLPCPYPFLGLCPILFPSLCHLGLARARDHGHLDPFPSPAHLCSYPCPYPAQPYLYHGLPCPSLFLFLYLYLCLGLCLYLAPSRALFLVAAIERDVQGMSVTLAVTVELLF